jgi:adenylyl- and sulfurtransferase ThiI
MMNYDIILVRYGELSLKSTYVRKYFESTLVRNIKKALAQENIPYNITKERGRIYLSTTEISNSCLVLSRIFGIVSFSPAVQTTSDMGDMSIVALQLTKNILTKEKSFAIRSTRVGTHTFSSQQVAIQIGNDIVKTTHAKVDLTHPDIELFIEIREKKSFLFTEKIKGVGGLPLGTQGKILVLVENPFSLLAAWYLMHRGCNAIIANTNIKNDESLYSFLHNWYVDAEIVSIDQKTKNFFHQLHALASENNCDALVTGHTFEASPCSLETISQLKKQSNIPVFTPLISMTLEELQQQCKKRGIPI